MTYRAFVDFGERFFMQGKVYGVIGKNKLLGGGMSKNRVFIVEDDLPVMESLKKLLLISGFEVEASDAPKEIMGAVKHFAPDIILLDLLMPGLGGLEVCQMLNADKQTRGIPIVVISALTNAADIKKAYELGVVEYFTKPYIYSKLEKRIREIIGYKDSRNS